MMAEDESLDSAGQAGRPDGSGLKSVVGIGSSAGGLEALQELVRQLVPETGMAFVVAQHLSPDRSSLIAELLGRHAPIPVREAVDGQILAPDTVVVAPPDCDILVDGDCLRLRAPSVDHGPSPSIDRLFESIAQSWAAQGIGIILSGTGSDGAHGLRTLKAADGLTIAQTPESAKFASMPSAAILMGGIDLVLPASAIGQHLVQLAAIGGWIAGSVPTPEPVLLATALSHLRRVGGVDFTGYKSSTIWRQIHRRMFLRRISTVEDYLTVLAAEDSEAHALERNLLVSVTSFFRDTSQFTALARALATYLTGRDPDDPLRVWVPGCATGEEVYTVAMLVAEALGHPRDLSRRLKIFGTDLDESSLSVARRAAYPASAALQIPADLQRRYVTPGPDGIEIARDMRDCAVFARHNILTDPPFPRLDLVSCRNLLIYFTAPMQERALASMRYALRPGGLLFLGMTETLGNAAVGFDSYDPESRIFERTERPVPATLPSSTAAAFTSLRPARRETSPDLSTDPHADDRSRVREALLQELTPPSLVLDEQGNLVEVLGDVSDYCRLPPGAPPSAAARYVRPELQAELRALLLVVRAEAITVQGPPVLLGEDDRLVRLRVSPLRGVSAGLVVVSFRDIKEDDEALVNLAPRDAAIDIELERLEEQLYANQESLRRSLDRFETVNEELQASSEELLASSEELQASFEELETSNEELRATNDELAEANAALHERSDELLTVNRDLEVILASLSQGIVLVDSEASVTRFSPMAVRLFALIDADIGRPLVAVPTTMPIPRLGDALHSVIDGGPALTWEVQGESGAFLMRVLPYPDDAGDSGGAIVTFTDVTEIVETRIIRQAVFNSTLEPHVLLRPVRDEAGGIIDFEYADANEVACAYMRIEHSDLVGARLSTLYPEQAASAAVRMYTEVFESNEPLVLDDWAYPYQQPGSENFYDIRGVRTEDLLSVAWRDVTEHHHAKEALIASEELYRLITMNSRDVIVHWDEGQILWVSQSLEAILGWPPEEWVGSGLGSFMHPDDDGLAPEVFALRNGEATRTRHRMRTKDGEYHWVECHGQPFVDSHGQPDGFLTSIHIVDDEVAAEQELARIATHDALTGLLNRLEGHHALDAANQRHREPGDDVAVLFCDVDNFKSVNDQYGHLVGDAVLRTLAQRLTDCVRHEDTVARIGGDELLVILDGVHGLVEAISVAKKIRDEAGKPIVIQEHSITATVSIGVTLARPGESYDSLVGRADDAMFHAKSRGRNGVFALSVED